MLELQQYFQVTFEAARKHYEAVADAVRVPIRLYNLPRATRFDFTPQLVAAMSDIPAIQSVKDASGDVTRLRDIRAVCGQRYDLYCGLHYQALEGFQLGADGWEVMTHPLLTHRLVKLVSLLTADPWSPESQSDYIELQPLFLFFKEYGVPQSIKAMSEWTELKLGRPRAPYTELSPPQKIRLRAILYELELLH